MAECDLSESISALIQTLRVRFASLETDALNMELKNTLREFCVRSNA
jgi:hypothetical protein